MRFREKGRNEDEEGESTTHATSLTHTNYFKPKKNVLATKENVIKMSRNKSIIRSSSTGSYPYPRTHTTLMVIPSNRPPPSPSSSTKPPNKLFTGVRRRPPLNRACPPIPESKSNESIMSHASRVSEKKAQTPQPIEDLIIENRNVVDVLDSNSNIRASSTTTNKKMSSTPRSPLMSVAHSVKNKLTRITNIGRSSTTTTTTTSTKKSSSAIKTSQSFSGIRQPKTVAKRIDQNANRVIKSSSMDVSQPSTSKVSIPQDPTPLNHDKIEEISESGLVPKSEIAEVITPPREQFCVKLEEDVLVVTRQFDEQYPGQKRSASPDALLDNNGNPPEGDVVVTEVAPEVVEVIEKEKEVITTKMTEEIPRPEVVVHQLLEKREASPEKFTMVHQEPPTTKYVLTVKTPEALRRHHTFTIADREGKPEPRISKSKSDCEVKPKKLVKQKSEPEPDREREFSPERYVMIVKTPEALRKHRTLTIGVRENPEPELVSKVEVKNLEKVAKLKRDTSKDKEEEFPPTKYVMVMKTPEALRKHRTLTIGQRAQSLEDEAPRVKVQEKIKRDHSEPPMVTKYVMTVKTPEALRKHRTLTIGQRAVSLDEEEVKVTSIKNLEKVAKLRRDTSLERPVEAPAPSQGSTKFVMVMKTPEALRRHHTFTIGDRPRSPDYPYIEEGELTEPIATVGPPAERRRRQESKEKKRREWEEYDKPPAEKFILTTSMTPNTMRRYQTFVVEPKKAAPLLPTSMSAEPMVKRSESSSSKSSYLKRLQFELFRGRSRERKSDSKDTKRQKSLDERKPESAQKYILSTTTPVMMRKYQTFSIVNKKNSNGEEEDDERTDNKNIESIAASYQSPVNFYSITATTPVTSRKVFREEPEPEPRHLFVLGGGPNGRRSPRDASNSDMAERKSTASGDLTSPEEEIPMDTNLTPTTEEQPIVTRRIDLMMNSPIEEEPESLALSKSEVSVSVPMAVAPPVFTPPSPPPVQLVPKSTSTSSASSGASSSSSRKPTQLPIISSNITQNPMHIVELRPDTKHQSKKAKIASKSLRNAGKMLTPSFLRKDRKSDKKVHGYVKTTTSGRQHVSERVAPLAEGESSVVANSPLVENLPITFEKWSEKSPRQGVKRFSETIVEEGLDANANSVLETQIHLNHQNSSAPAHDTGLIDDDIMDQPMLVGDTFSHSSSIDCISTSQLPPPNFISESIISIDRSSIMHETTRNTPDRQRNESAYNRSPNLNLTRQIDAGLCEVEDIKTQLQRLNKLVNEMGVSSWEDEITRLRRENEQLRRELAQRDATIAALQSQTASA